jgi:hypothetical protein
LRPDNGLDHSSFPVTIRRVAAGSRFLGRCSVSISLLGVSLASAAVADAESFVWRAPESCPQRAAVLEQLAEVLGSADGGRGASRLEHVEIEGAISRGGERWLLDLAVKDGASRRSRRISSEDCAELAHAAALSLALLLEEAAEAAPASTPEAAVPALSPTPAEPARPAQDAPPPRLEPEASAPTLGLAVGVQSLLDTSMLAQPALGVGLGLRASLSRWSLAAQGHWFPARRTPVSADRDVEFEQWALGLRPCATLLGVEWTLDACAVGEAGRVLARGLSLDRARDASSAWLAAGLGLGARWNRPGGALGLHVDGLVPLSRERYVVNAAQEVHETPAVTLRLALAIELGL